MLLVVMATGEAERAAGGSDAFMGKCAKWRLGSSDGGRSSCWRASTLTAPYSGYRPEGVSAVLCSAPACSVRVEMRRTQNEHNESALALSLFFLFGCEEVRPSHAHNAGQREIVSLVVVTRRVGLGAVRVASASYDPVLKDLNAQTLAPLRRRLAR